MTYTKIVYNLTGVPDDEQELIVGSTDSRDIAKNWYDFCYQSGIIDRTVEVKEEEGGEE